jgi:hypothetical protein
MPLLDLTISATTRLGLEPLKGTDGKYLYGGIVPTRVVDFHVGSQKHTKGEFKDLDVPVLQVEFENFKLNASDPDRFYTHSLKIVGTKQLVKGTIDQYEDRPALDVDNDTISLWKSIKHFLESLAGSPNYRNIVDIPKDIQLSTFDLPGLLPNITSAERITKYQKFFDYLVAFVNGDGKDIKSQILTTEGDALPMWVKVLPNYDKDAKRNAKYFGISRFINQGVFETMKLDKGIPAGGPKIIRIKATESLELIATTSGPSNMGASSGNLPNAGGIDPAVQNLLKG